MTAIELVKYTDEEFIAAYNAWAEKGKGELFPHPNHRIAEWDHYCDIRDSLPLGTTMARRTRKEVIMNMYTSRDTRFNNPNV